MKNFPQRSKTKVVIFRRHSTNPYYMDLYNCMNSIHAYGYYIGPYGRKFATCFLRRIGFSENPYIHIDSIWSI